MRSVALVLLAALLSGCLALAPERTVSEQDASVEPGRTWYTTPLDPSRHWSATFEVSHAEGKLEACVVTDGDPDRSVRLDPFFWNFSSDAGCAELGAPNATSADLVPDAEARTLALDCLGDAPCSARVLVVGKSVARSTETAEWIAVVLLAVLALRVVADQLDRARIRDFVQEHGGTVRSISWQPFGRGWFGERGERVYAIAYVDEAGEEREATVKTSLFSGVWSDELGGRRGE
jgi:hypothetical protein